MYLVHYKAAVIGYNLCKFETLEEARVFVSDLATKGVREFYVSQEIPMKIRVEVEF